jgi:hypothetical protein
VIVPVPGFEWYVRTAHALGYEILHLLQQGIRFVGVIDKALENFRCYALAIVMVRAHYVSVDRVWRGHVNGMAVGWRGLLRFLATEGHCQPDTNHD